MFDCLCSQCGPNLIFFFYGSPQDGMVKRICSNQAGIVRLAYESVKCYIVLKITSAYAGNVLCFTGAMLKLRST
jgi:hypothetical protein